VSKTSITVRLDSSVLQEIDSKCNTESYCRSDFIKNAINEALKPEKVEPLVIKHGKILDDFGNIIGTF